MARAIKKLTARIVATITRPGRHSDGAGLYLLVDQGGAKRWLFLFRWTGKLKEMGLGGVAAVSLADARERASEARRLLASGINPIDKRRTEKASQKRAVTFGALAEELLPEISQGFRSRKHLDQWSATVRTYFAPIKEISIADVSTADVLKVLSPIWNDKPTTAQRVRGRIERVLDAAKAKGLRSGDNPARWRGHLDYLLARPNKLSKQPHPAMPFIEVPLFLSRLRKQGNIPALALEFTILTAARSGEVRDARWSEIDLDNRIWAVPGHKMKAGRAHRVPLSGRAVDILRELEELRRGDLVFPGRRPGRSISGATFHRLLAKMDVPYTSHGFRSSFRDWAGEVTDFPREVAEAALAHAVGDATERAYRRGDALEKRRAMMVAWAGFVGEAVR